MRRDVWKTALGTLAAGMILLGCFAPIIYGVYALSDKGDRQVIEANLMETPENVYKTVVATMEERGGKIVERNDKEMFLSGKSKGGQDGTLKVTGLAAGGSKLTITIEKGKDPKGEREEIVNTVLSVCSKRGIQCSEQKEKK